MRLNKWTILFLLKEQRDRRIAMIVRRTKKEFHKLVVEAFFTPSPLLSRLKENVKRNSIS